jgi:hypothetical protein
MISREQASINLNAGRQQHPKLANDYAEQAAGQNERCTLDRLNICFKLSYETYVWRLKMAVAKAG